MKDAPELKTIPGGDVNIKFIFRWGDEDKSFNLHVFGD